MAVAIFAAIAFVPRFIRVVHNVHATAPTNDVALIACDRDGSQIQVFLVTSTDASTTLPAIGSDCGKGIALLQSQGFSQYVSIGAGGVFPQYLPSIGSIISNPYPLWTLYRATPPT
jgi:hypothetical protein